MRPILAALLACSVLLVPGRPAALTSALPNRPDSLKFAVLGDFGTGERAQYEVGDQMARERQQFPFDLVVTVGDNFYGGQRPGDLVNKFERPYKALLDAGITFQGALGNHDESHTVDYAPLNMGGRRYYTFARRDVRFFILDTNSVEPRQLTWFEGALQETREPWKIAVFHHPIYGNAGRHGASVDLRLVLEPLLLRYGISVALSGHDHVYERLLPQKGIHYFVTGSGGQLRKGDLQRSSTTAAGFDQDRAFMLVEIAGDEMSFEVISRTGATVDSGTIRRRPRSETEAMGS
jgi:hypothetical protein